MKSTLDFSRYLPGAFASRELLSRTGSLSRLDAGGLQVLPKVRTPPAGISPRSLSRYACVARPPVAPHRRRPTPDRLCRGRRRG